MESFWVGFEKAADAKVYQFPYEAAQDKAENRRWARSMQENPKPQSDAKILKLQGGHLSGREAKMRRFKQTTLPNMARTAKKVAPIAAVLGLYGTALGMAIKADKKRQAELRKGK